MAYIAFLDMIGTRAAAQISKDEYMDAINTFHNQLRSVAQIHSAKVYGYSDNAYAEFDELEQMVRFFRALREQLMNNHRYFTAAVDFDSHASLDAKIEKIKPNDKNSDPGLSVRFTNPIATDVYLNQTSFSGIGISLSSKVIEQMDIKEKARGYYCQSVFQNQLELDRCDKFNNIYSPYYDLSYIHVSTEAIEYIISDYIYAAALNGRAGRYYISPIISMIKSLTPKILNNLYPLVSILTFEKFTSSIKSIPSNLPYSKLFTHALIDRILSFKISDPDKGNACKEIISKLGINSPEEITLLSEMPNAIISNLNKREVLKIIHSLPAN